MRPFLVIENKKKGGCHLIIYSHLFDPLFTFEMLNTSKELLVKLAKSISWSWSPEQFTGRRMKTPINPAIANTLKLHDQDKKNMNCQQGQKKKKKEINFDLRYQLEYSAIGGNCNIQAEVKNLLIWRTIANQENLKALDCVHKWTTLVQGVG